MTTLNANKLLNFEKAIGNIFDNILLRLNFVKRSFAKRSVLFSLWKYFSVNFL